MAGSFEKTWIFACATAVAALVSSFSPGAHADEHHSSKDDSLAQAVTREELVREALARNPGVRASKRRASALRTEADAERRLPPPQAGVDVWQIPFSKPYDVPGANMIMFSLRQDFTPGRAARGEERERSAALERTLVGEKLRELGRDVGHAFFDYVESSELHRIHLAHKGASDRIVSLTRLRYTTGGDLMDTAQADVEAATVETEIVSEAENLEGARAKLNGLLLRDPDAPLGPPQVPPAEAPDESLAALVTRARGTRSDVRANEARRSAEIARARAEESQSNTPTFSVGALYFAPTRDTPRNAYGVSLAATLPWLWGRGRMSARAAREMASATEDDVSDSSARVQTEISAMLTRARAAAKRYQSIRDRALPAAQRAEQAAQAGYTTGKTSALSLFTAHRSVVEAEVELIRARVMLGHALVDLEWAVGSPIKTRRLDPQP